MIMEVVPEYKIILLGEPGVGKTNFFFRLREGVFVGNTASTVCTGIEHHEYNLETEDGLHIKANLFDTAGGERFRTLTSNYYINADAAILMYSVEDTHSFERLKDEVDNASRFINPSKFVWALVGHKSDLICEINQDSIAAWAAQLDTNLSFFASSKTGENVVPLFHKVLAHVHKVSEGKPRCYTNRSGQTRSLHRPHINKSTTTKSNDSSGCSC